MSANRGKYAEGKVMAFLNEWKAKVKGFTFNRILDAHASKGAMANPQPGDFQWFLATGHFIVGTTPDGENLYVSKHGTVPYTRNGLIEVKQVEHHFRLPCKNFGPDQVARMRMRSWAGSEPLVLVCFHPEPRVTMWRAAPLDFFEVRPGPKPESGSWDMSEIDAYTECSDILVPYLT
jgi:hypothetical protein